MRNSGVKIDATRAKYDTCKEAIKRAGLVPVSRNQNAPFVWIDGILYKETALEYDPGQICGKIPCMDYLCYKSTLFSCLNSMRSFYPFQYNVYPKTYLLPQDFLEFQREHTTICGRTGVAPTWILKPKNGCCGRGITIVQSTHEVQNLTDQSVIQMYVKPYLIDGKKFDFRLYILIASLDPLTIFIYNEGIARFCSENFQMPNKSNKDDKFIHLTNTAINVENGHCDASVFTRKASEVFDMIEKKSHNRDVLWAKICNCARAVIFAVIPKLFTILPKKKTLLYAKSTPKMSTIHKHLNRPFNDEEIEENQAEEDQHEVSEREEHPEIHNENKSLTENQFQSAEKQKVAFSNTNENSFALDQSSEEDEKEITNSFKHLLDKDDLKLEHDSNESKASDSVSQRKPQYQTTMKVDVVKHQTNMVLLPGTNPKPGHEFQPLVIGSIVNYKINPVNQFGPLVIQRRFDFSSLTNSKLNQPRPSYYYTKGGKVIKTEGKPITPSTKSTVFSTRASSISSKSQKAKTFRDSLHRNIEKRKYETFKLSEKEEDEALHKEQNDNERQNDQKENHLETKDHFLQDLNSNDEKKEKDPYFDLEKNEEDDGKEKPKLTPLRLKKRFYHVLGIDIMLDSNLEPQVLELNDRPSLSVTVDFERDLKVGLLSETFEHISPTGEVFGESEKSGWKQIFPLPEDSPDAKVWNEIYEKIKHPNSNGEIDGVRVNIRSPILEQRVPTKEKSKKKKGKSKKGKKQHV